MNKVDYHKKIEDHLNNSHIYEPLDNNPIEPLRTKINKQLKTLENKKKIDRNQYLKLYSTPANIPLFYGLIKLHKEGHPIRPIVSFCGSPTDELSKFLTKILNPITDNAPQKLKNTLMVKDALSDIVVPEDHLMVSFDVKSLFTCIPLFWPSASIEWGKDEGQEFQVIYLYSFTKARFETILQTAVQYSNSKL